MNPLKLLAFSRSWLCWFVCWFVCFLHYIQRKQAEQWNFGLILPINGKKKFFRGVLKGIKRTQKAKKRTLTYRKIGFRVYNGKRKKEKKEKKKKQKEKKEKKERNNTHASRTHQAS